MILRLQMPIITCEPKHGIIRQQQFVAVAGGRLMYSTISTEVSAATTRSTGYGEKLITSRG